MKNKIYRLTIIVVMLLSLVITSHAFEDREKTIGKVTTIECTPSKFIFYVDKGKPIHIKIREIENRKFTEEEEFTEVMELNHVMVNLVRDAFKYGWTVTVEHEENKRRIEYLNAQRIIISK